MIQSALITKLLTVTSNTYANVTPTNPGLPSITVDLDASFRNRHWSGGNTSTGLIETDFEVTCWGETAAQVYSLGKQVVDLLENFSGPVLGGDSPQTTYNISGIEIVDEQSDFDTTQGFYGYSVFITITHKG